MTVRKVKSLVCVSQTLASHLTHSKSALSVLAYFLLNFMYSSFVLILILVLLSDGIENRRY